MEELFFNKPDPAVSMVDRGIINIIPNSAPDVKSVNSPFKKLGSPTCGFRFLVDFLLDGTLCLPTLLRLEFT